MSTLRKEIIDTGKRLLKQEGWEKLSIRDLAKESDVAVGTIYNYFGSKSGMLRILTDDIWKEIFGVTENANVYNSLEVYIVRIYECLENGQRLYPEFFSLAALPKAMGEDANLLLERKTECVTKLVQVMNNDENIRDDAFSEPFSQEAFAEMLLAELLMSQLTCNFDPQPLLALIRRVCY